MIAVMMNWDRPCELGYDGIETDHVNLAMMNWDRPCELGYDELRQTMWTLLWWIETDHVNLAMVIAKNYP